MKYALALIAALAFATPALAQHKHGDNHKGPNGGPVEDIAGVHAELVVSGTTITLNILDEANKPLPSKGYTGSALVVTGSEREAVTLAPSGWVAVARRSVIAFWTDWLSLDPSCDVAMSTGA